MRHSTNLRKLGISLGAFGIIIAGPIQAGPTAKFDGQGSRAEPNLADPDGFPGSSGNGWVDSWEMSAQNKSIDLDAQIIDTQPFDADSGDYLQMSYTRHGGDTGSRGGVVRQISNYPADGGIDPLQPYQVKFQFRLDDVSGEFNAMTDAIIFGESLEANTGGPSDKDRWGFLYRAANDAKDNTGGAWTAFHGTNGDRQVMRFGPENFLLQPGTVCNVTVSVDPTAGTWDAEIAYQGEVFRISDDNTGLPVPLRNSTPPSDPTFLSFRATRNGEGSTVLWSIDNVEVTQ